MSNEFMITPILDVKITCKIQCFFNLKKLNSSEKMYYLNLHIGSVLKKGHFLELYSHLILHRIFTEIN